MTRSLVPLTTARPTGRRVDGAPVFEFVRSPAAPPVSVLRFPAGELPEVHQRLDHAHVHDFLVLAYFERGAGRLRLGAREWPLSSGDAFVVAPGEVVRFSGHGPGEPAVGWCVFFPPELVAPEPLGAALGWRAHPLLYRFVGRQADGGQRLPVPAADRPAWSQRVRAIEAELREPRDGSAEAALAHLTLLLVSAARISVDVGQDLRQRSEPLLAAVFEFIEAHYGEPISLATVAAEVGLTPGHLTTVVRRKTGRSVQRWITERRMAEARRLLCTTDLTVEAVASRTGYRQASFFIRQFRRDHAVTPAAWRSQSRAS